MSGKITAHFGADVSEVEAGMLKAQRATKSYERAVKGVSGSGKSLDFSGELSRTNEQLAKATNLMKGGAILASISAVFTAFAKLSNFSKELGSSATDGQKSMAKWSDEAKSAGTAVTSFLSNAVGQVLELTRSWVGLRSAQIEAGDEIVKSTGDAADAAEVRLAKAQQRAKLNESEEQALKRARDASRIADAKLSEGSSDPEKMAALKRDAIKADGELAALEKKAGERKKEDAKKAADEAESRRKRDLGLQMDANERLRKQEEDAAEQKQKDAKEFADFFKAIDEAAVKAHEENLKNEADAQKEADDLRYARTWKFSTDEQKVAQVRKEGRAAQAAYDKNASAENLAALEKTRAKWLDLKDEIQGANKSAKGEGTEDPSGRVRGADGKLRRGKTIISDEDAERSDKTRARDALLNREALRGRIRDVGKVGGDAMSLKNVEALLAKIDGRLTPRKL